MIDYTGIDITRSHGWILIYLLGKVEVGIGRTVSDSSCRREDSGINAADLKKLKDAGFNTSQSVAFAMRKACGKRWKGSENT